MRRKVIALLNDKGGVGRTMVGVSLAEALAKRGKHILFGDMDPQANATRRLRVDNSNPDKTLAHCLDIGRGPVQKGSAADYIQPCGWENEAAGRIAVLPSHLALTARAAEAGATAAVRRLWRALGDLPEQVHYTILDTPPGFGHNTQMCLEAADYALIVATAEHDGAEGAKTSAEFLRDYGEDLGGLELLGVIVNQVREQTVLHRTYLAGLSQLEVLNGLVLQPYLPLRVDIGVAMSNADPPSTINPALWGTINQLADKIEERLDV